MTSAWTARVAKTLVALTLVFGSAVACSAGDPDFDPNLPDFGVAEDGSKPHELVSAAKPSGCAVKAEPKCKKPQMEVAAQSTAAMIDDFARATFASPEEASVKPKLLWIPSGSWKRNDCGSSKEHPQKVAGRFMYYCSKAKVVYVGQGAFWGMYGYGYLVPLLFLGHEATHWEQDAVGAPLTELQADCFAGALIGYLRAKGAIDPNEDVIGQTMKLFKDVAEKVGDDPGHGSLDERRQMLTDGLTKGAKYCNSSFDNKLRLK